MNARTKWLLVIGAIATALPASCGLEAERMTGGPKRVTIGAGGGGAGGGPTTATGPVCGATCEHEACGAGTGDPFDVGSHDSAGVKVGEDGALELNGAGQPGGKDLIWIASSGGGFVSKFDTTTYAELGRYRTGQDPSRTSVDARGDVYVGNRTGEGVTKVSSAGADCPDTNGDGVVKTSKGSAELLGYGQDDCVLWTTSLGHTIRGVAAQERVVGEGEDPRSDVWVGALDGALWKLDGETGKVLAQATPPCPVYGLALDGDGQLWMTGGDCLGRLDTTLCFDDASCAAVDLCESACDASGACGDECDAEGAQRLSLPDSTYGITVDYRGRVWLGGGQGVKRYDPHAPSAKRYAIEKVGFAHGIAADAQGSVWAARDPEVVRLDGDTMAHSVIPTSSSKGMAVDRAGKIWAVSYMMSFASVIVPGPGLDDNQLIENAVTGLAAPYTYSDMTGVQAALATGGSGRYVQRFTGCPDGDTAWIELAWDATVPKGTVVGFRVRTGENDGLLKVASWIGVATVPSAVSPASVTGALAKAGVASAHLLEVELTMTVTASAASPKVKGFKVGYACPKAPTIE